MNDPAKILTVKSHVGRSHYGVKPGKDRKMIKTYEAIKLENFVDFLKKTTLRYDLNVHVPCPNSYVEIPTPNMMVLGDGPLGSD
jgi:hypothetical protein